MYTVFFSNRLKVTNISEDDKEMKINLRILASLGRADRKTIAKRYQIILNVFIKYNRITKFVCARFRSVLPPLCFGRPLPL